MESGKRRGSVERQRRLCRLKATTVLALEVETASAKVRSGPPKDDAEDYELPVWAGVLPMLRSYGPPESDPDALRGEEVSESVRRVMG